MCGLGRLYSKQNVIEHLLDKEKPMPESAQHIKTLKDIKDLQLTANPAYNKADEKLEGAIDVRSAPFICKLIGLEMSGKFRFVALWQCGCVVSERALKELKLKVCCLCQTPYVEEDVVILNGNEADTDLMRVRMEARVARRKAGKKDKQKAKKAQALAEAPATAVASCSTSLSSSGEAVEAGPSRPTTVVPATKPKLADPKTTKRNQMDKLAGPDFKKAKDDYSVAKDPKASDVYKSLFTTHESEKAQERAHWVTFNPFYM